MGTFTRISEDAFNELQVDAGVLLSSFNPASPSISDSAIITATTGGVTVSCVPTYSDYFADVDNAPNNTKEGKHLDGWDCKISTTALGATPAAIKLSLGAADIDSQDSTKITPRASVGSGDFSDIWWVGDKADGGMVAIQLKNALSTGGFSLKTTKNGKGNLTLELTGHISVSSQTTVPMVFYATSGGSGGTTGGTT